MYVPLFQPSMLISILSSVTLVSYMYLTYLKSTFNCVLILAILVLYILLVHAKNIFHDHFF